jgi:hypothetical protein
MTRIANQGARSQESGVRSGRTRAKLTLSLLKAGNSLWLASLLVAILLAASPASAQVTTGLPP